ncbi:MAG: hypothetical protein V1781_05845 [Bacteroidota bacterium]
MYIIINFNPSMKNPKSEIRNSDFKIPIDKDSRSPYENTRKNKVNTPEARYYKVRFLLKDKEVGIESDVTKVLAEIYAPLEG